jgi:hypothetical protein
MWRIVEDNGSYPPLATIYIPDFYVMRGGYLYVFKFSGVF